ncbi:LPP20 family lipoprotein [Colwelliaceae bacterium 6441]
MINALKKVVIIGASVVTLMACSSVYDKHVQWQTIKPETFPIITAIGQAPISLQNSPNKTQRMLMAINASKIAAYAELAEQVYGQQVSNDVTMSNLLINDHQLKSSVQGVIRGAKVIKSYPVGDTYTTELHLDFKDVYDIYIAASRNKEIKKVRYY